MEGGSAALLSRYWWYLSDHYHYRMIHSDALEKENSELENRNGRQDYHHKLSSHMLEDIMPDM